MVIKTTKFTPEVLLSAPRRGAAIPNHDGTLALYTVSSYSFETKEETKEIRILDINTGNSTLFSNDPKAHDSKWLGDGSNAIIWLKSGENGITSIMIGDGDEPSKASYTADVILAPMKNLKTVLLQEGSIAIAMSGLATEDGSLYNEETAEKPASTARLYDKTFIRFFDSYMIKQKNVIWYSRLQKSKEGMYSLAGPVHNALKRTEFECPFPNNSADTATAFDLGPTGIAFIAQDPTSNPGLEWDSDAYFMHIRVFTDPAAGGYKFNSPLSGGYQGVKLSSDGSRAALIQRTNTHDTVDSRLMLAYLNIHTSKAHEMFKGENGNSAWHLIPSGMEFSRDGKYLYITAEDCGRGSLFFTPTLILNDASGKTTLGLPQKLFHQGTVTGAYSLDNKSQKLLVSSSSLVENSVFQIIDPFHPSDATIVNSSSKNGLKLGLSHKQISEMYFEGAGDYCVQAWVVKPSFFDEKKKYPLALLIHGGPQDSWGEAWSTRWNPCVWAEQGYVVVQPNITGSTGFGLDFTKGVEGEWGGRPYHDLENCFEYVAKNMPFVDTDRAIAAGASYGGYMANWIQGMPLGRKFKAIVSHDGIFNIHNGLGSDIFVDDNSQFNGASMFPWDGWEKVEKYSPSRADRCKNWATPMLIIHSEKDFRCVIDDGISAFHVCQKLGIPSQFLNFPDEGHWVLGQENSLFWHHTVFKFVNKYSGISDESTATSSTHSQEAQSSIVEDVVPDMEELSIETDVQGQEMINEDLWTQELDLKLFIARAQGMSWEWIAEFHFPDKTALMCEDRYQKLVVAGHL